MAKTNKSFLNSIRTSFNSLGANETEETKTVSEEQLEKQLESSKTPEVKKADEKEEKKEEISTEKIEPKVSKPVKEAEKVVEDEEDDIEVEVEEYTDSKEEEKKESRGEESRALPVNNTVKESFEDAVKPYNGGFYVIKTNASDTTFAVGLESVENKNVVEPLVFKIIENKDAFYSYLDRNAFSLFKGDYEKGKVKILSLNNGLQLIVGIDNVIKEEREKEINGGFIKNIDEQYGRIRKVSTYIPEEFEIYCRRRAALSGVYKGQIKFVICNLINKDREKHLDLL